MATKAKTTGTPPPKTKSPQDRVDDTINLVTKGWGNLMIQQASTCVKERVPRLVSNTFIWDLLSGGGLPMWKFVEFHGKKSSGKTTHALRLVGNFLRQNKTLYALYVDFENSYDPLWINNFVDTADLSRLIRIRPGYAEEGIDVTLATLRSMTSLVGFVFVDSLGGMISVADAEKDAIEDTMGMQAKVINKLFRKLIPIVVDAQKQERPLYVLMINHMTSDFKAKKFASPDKKVGGNYQEFVLSLDVRWYHKEYTKLGGISAAAINTFRIEKNKLSGTVTKRSGEFAYALVPHNNLVAGEVDDLETVILYAKKVGFITKDGNKWRVGTTHLFANQAEVSNFFRRDIAAQKILRKKTLDACLADIFLSGDETAKEIE